MYSDSPFYRKAFERYVRTGLSIEMQMKAAADALLDALLLMPTSPEPGSGATLVQDRISELRAAFTALNREFPNQFPPNTSALEQAFDAQQHALLGTLSLRPDNVSAEDWDTRRASAQDFLRSRFRQQIDPILQPYYGVENFTWVSTSDNPCSNCAAHEGNVYAWMDGDFPPGCDHCQCAAEPYFGPKEKPLDPVYPVETILLGLMAPQALLAIREAFATWRGARTVAGKYDGVIRTFGGPPDKTFTNKKGDIIMIGNGKKIRFDAKNSHGYDPHFHIEEMNSEGDWVDAGSQHAYPFRKE